MDPETLTFISRIFNGVILAAIGLGVWQRFRPKVHMPIMITCLIIDVANVLVIELNRKAIEKTIDSFSKGENWILLFHIAVSVISLVCYGIALATGIRLFRRGTGRRAHRWNAGIFLACRVLNFITSFWIGG